MRKPVMGFSMMLDELPYYEALPRASVAAKHDVCARAQQIEGLFLAWVESNVSHLAVPPEIVDQQRGSCGRPYSSPANTA